MLKHLYRNRKKAGFYSKKWFTKTFKERIEINLYLPTDAVKPAVKADPLLHLLLKPWFSHIFMFQIFSTLALSCLLTVQAPLPPAQLHLHLERHPSQRNSARSQERDGYLRAQDHLLFPNEAAGLQTPHTVIFLSWKLSRFCERRKNKLQLL